MYHTTDKTDNILKKVVKNYLEQTFRCAITECCGVESNHFVVSQTPLMVDSTRLQILFDPYVDRVTVSRQVFQASDPEFFSKLDSFMLKEGVVKKL